MVRCMAGKPYVEISYPLMRRITLDKAEEVVIRDEERAEIIPILTLALPLTEKQKYMMAEGCRIIGKKTASGGVGHFCGRYWHLEHVPNTYVPE